MSAEQLRAHMDGAYAYRLLDALGKRSGPAVRTHDGVNMLPEEVTVDHHGEVRG